MDNFFLILDTETGGLNSKTNSLNEIAAALCDEQGKQIEQFQIILNPYSQNKLSSLYALKLSSLFERGTNFKQIDNTEIANQFAQWLIMISTKYNPILVGHNLKFDLEFLESFMQANGFEKPFEIFSPHIIDTIMFAKILSLSGKIKSKKMNLATLCEEFDIKNENAHTAMADVEATTQLLIKFFSLLK